MDRVLKRSLGLDMWHLVALVVVVMYARFVFHRIADRIPLINLIGNGEMSYYVADGLAALLFLHLIMGKDRAVRMVAAGGLLWLAMNYILRMEFSHENWYAYDGYAMAAFLAAYLR
ncbi:MAG: hypothetical protein CL669_05620 [Balneola sp.]|nr:hypothetical protein [Balneola sp.]